MLLGKKQTNISTKTRKLPASLRQLLYNREQPDLFSPLLHVFLGNWGFLFVPVELGSCTQVACCLRWPVQQQDHGRLSVMGGFGPVYEFLNSYHGHWFGVCTPNPISGLVQVGEKTVISDWRRSWCANRYWHYTKLMPQNKQHDLPIFGPSYVKVQDAIFYFG